jgi:hypothetical protein
VGCWSSDLPKKGRSHRAPGASEALRSGAVVVAEEGEGAGKKAPVHQLLCVCVWSVVAALLLEAGTTSQLDRSDFQSITGTHEGAFPAEPATGDHPRGSGGAMGAGGWGPDPPGYAKPGYALENESRVAAGGGRSL